MGRRSVEVKRIGDRARREASFTKRGGGLLKKAHELAVLCDAQVGVLACSSAGKLFDYCSPNAGWGELIHRYETISNNPLQDTDGDDADQQMFTEIARLRIERDHLEASIRRQTGEDLSPVATREELHHLEQKLEPVLGKIRERKDELLNQQVDDTHHRLHVLEDQNSFLRRTIEEDERQHRAAGELTSSAVAAERKAAATALTDFFPEEVSTLLQMRPQLHDDVQDRLITHGKILVGGWPIGSSFEPNDIYSSRRSNRANNQ